MLETRLCESRKDSRRSRPDAVFALAGGARRMAGLQQRASHAVQRTFYKTFYAWGSFVGRRPILVILISTILAFAASVSAHTAGHSQPLGADVLPPLAGARTADPRSTPPRRRPGCSCRLEATRSRMRTSRTSCGCRRRPRRLTTSRCTMPSSTRLSGAIPSTSRRSRSAATYLPRRCSRRSAGSTRW